MAIKKKENFYRQKIQTKDIYIYIPDSSIHGGDF